MKLRIVFLSREFPPDTQWGGQAVACYDMAEILAKNGNRVSVICQAVGKQSIKIVDDVFVYRVGRNPQRYSVLSTLDYAVHSIVMLWKICARERSVVVEGFLFGIDVFLCSALKKLKMLRMPLIIHAHGSLRYALLYSSPSKSLFGPIALKLLVHLAEFSARNCDKVVAISPAMREELVKISKADINRVTLLLNPRNTVKFAAINSNVRDELDISHDDKMILAVGRLETRKGSHILSRAIPKVLVEFPRAKFVFLGEDSPMASYSSFKEYLMDIAKKTRSEHSIRFIDKVNETKLTELYSASDVVVSASMHEISTSIPLEAMLCGKPVVVTATGLANELCLDGSNGVVVEPGNPTELANAIVRMLSLTIEDKLRIAQINRRIIETKFSFIEWAEKVKGLHSGVFGERINEIS